MCPNRTKMSLLNPKASDQAASIIALEFRVWTSNESGKLKAPSLAPSLAYQPTVCHRSLGPSLKTKVLETKRP